MLGSTRRGVLDVLSRVPQSSGPRRLILLYHSVAGTPGLSALGPADFERQLDWITDTCDVVPLSEIRTTPIGDRPVIALTFDDGFVDNYTVAFPRIRERGVTATFFVTTGLVDGRTDVVARFARLHEVLEEDVRGVSWDDLGEMVETGMEVGAHTVTHPNLTAVSDSVLVEEIGRSAARITECLGIGATAFAYPFGKPKHHSDTRTAAAVASAGFSTAFEVCFRPVSPRDSALRMPRFAVSSPDIGPLAAMVHGSLDLLGAWQRWAPRAVSGAVSPQGRHESEFSLLSDG